MPAKRVLLIGLDPTLVDFSSAPELNAERVRAAGDDARTRLGAIGCEVHQCLLEPGTTDESAVLTALSQSTFDCVMIGAGLRAALEETTLFERVINAIHQNAPSAKLCFNSHPNNTVEAVQRWL
jgi:hypothetical protein